VSYINVAMEYKGTQYPQSKSQTAMFPMANSNLSESNQRRQAVSWP